jgi:folate-binding protein YgfZ
MSAEATFCKLPGTGLLAISGEDASTFLHAQLTSDVAGLVKPHTQYSGYCSPKGRLLATFLIWRRESDFVLQVSSDLAETAGARLSRYVMRSRVRVTAASDHFALTGVLGRQAPSALNALDLPVPAADHDVNCVGDVYVTRLPLNRYLVLAPTDRSIELQERLQSFAASEDESAWTAADIQAGIPLITEQTLEHYIPQMVNLDLIGAVSFTKGCYPGQEIVARTHYLGRVKQRMYRVSIRSERAVHAGDPLFSAQFGSEQASGSIVRATPIHDGAYEALAVIQRSAAGDAESIHLRAPDGPTLDILPLPYSVRD